MYHKGFLQADVTVQYKGQAFRVHLPNVWISDLTGIDLNDTNLWGFRVIEKAAANTESNTINHPEHYGGDEPYEAIKVIWAWKLNFNTGNSAKYICRAGKKGGQLEHIKDLEKARRYLDFEIERLKKSTLSDALLEERR